MRQRWKPPVAGEGEALKGTGAGHGSPAHAPGGPGARPGTAAVCCLLRDKADTTWLGKHRWQSPLTDLSRTLSARTSHLLLLSPGVCRQEAKDPSVVTPYRRDAQVGQEGSRSCSGNPRCSGPLDRELSQILPVVPA